MPADAFRCPECGSSLADPDLLDGQAVCPFCGAKVSVDTGPALRAQAPATQVPQYGWVNPFEPDLIQIAELAQKGDQASARKRYQQLYGVPPSRAREAVRAYLKGEPLLAGDTVRRTSRTRQRSAFSMYFTHPQGAILLILVLSLCFLLAVLALMATGLLDFGQPVPY